MNISIRKTVARMLQENTEKVKLKRRSLNQDARRNLKSFEKAIDKKYPPGTMQDKLGLKLAKKIKGKSTGTFKEWDLYKKTLLSSYDRLALDPSELKQKGFEVLLDRSQARITLVANGIYTKTYKFLFRNIIQEI